MRDPLSDDEGDLDPIDELFTEEEDRLTKRVCSISRSKTKVLKKPLSVWQRNIKLPFRRSAVANDCKQFKSIPRCLGPTGKTVNTCSDGFVGSERFVRERLPIVKSLRRVAASSKSKPNWEHGALHVCHAQHALQFHDPDRHSVAGGKQGTTPGPSHGDNRGRVPQDEDSEALEVAACLSESPSNTGDKADMAHQAGVLPREDGISERTSKRKVTFTDTRVRMQLSSVTAPPRPLSEASYDGSEFEEENMSGASSPGGGEIAQIAEPSATRLNLDNGSGEPPTERKGISICPRWQDDQGYSIRRLPATCPTVLDATDDILDEHDHLTVPGQAARMQSSGLWMEVDEQIDDDNSPNRAVRLVCRQAHSSIPKVPRLQLARSALDEVDPVVCRRQLSVDLGNSPIIRGSARMSVQERQKSIDLGESSMKDNPYSQAALRHERHQLPLQTPTRPRSSMKQGPSASLSFGLFTDNHIQCLQLRISRCTARSGMETMTSF